jgi:5-methylcytosine-specific restriction endonuclease McrA
MHIPPSDLDTVLNRALAELVQHMKGRRYGLSEHPRDNVRLRGGVPDERRIPAAIRRRVYERDGGRCTFVDPNGRRCSRVHDLVYDHIQPLARGGITTASNLRLLCSAHNQMEADRLLGATFMEGKRERGGEASPKP